MEIGWKYAPTEEYGVLCGCDQEQEWLLSWWWERYSFYNHYPVVFCDFGMSEKARAWCQERGKVISVSLDPSLIKPREEVSARLQQRWEWLKPEEWFCRTAFFKKPFAMLQSPFKVSVWIDLDCEILSPLEGLFAYSLQAPLALLPCGELRSEIFFCPVVHNGGVVVFHHGIDIFVKQAQMGLEWNHQFYAEDNVLSYLIYKTGFPIALLPAEWNWLMMHHPAANLFAHIIHWNESSKKTLKTSQGIKPLRDQLLKMAGG